MFRKNTAWGQLPYSMNQFPGPLLEAMAPSSTMVSRKRDKKVEVRISKRIVPS
jgi:hypothetical protein